MTLEALSDWKTTFASDMVPVSDASWPDTMTDWYVARIDTPLLSLPGLTLAVPPLPVTFGAAAFKAIFSSLAQPITQVAAMNIIANAWEAGLLATTVLVKPLDSIGVPSPATTWSAVTTSVFDPASIALGKAKILELIGAPNADNAEDSLTPVKFREATLLLTVTTTGLNSVTPTAGPLIDAARTVG